MSTSSEEKKNTTERHQWVISELVTKGLLGTVFAVLFLCISFLFIWIFIVGVGICIYEDVKRSDFIAKFFGL